MLLPPFSRGRWSSAISTVAELCEIRIQRFTQAWKGHAQSAAIAPKLNHVHARLPRFVPGDILLRHAQPFGDLGLEKSALNSQHPEAFEKPGVMGRKAGLPHTGKANTLDVYTKIVYFLWNLVTGSRCVWRLSCGSCVGCQRRHSHRVGSFLGNILMKKSVSVLLSLSLLLANSSCATIINGTTQKVGISSRPSGASVVVDEQPRGKTPVFVDLTRKDTHVVRIEMPGYDSAEIPLTRQTSGWVWGNILFGGLIGLVVDAASGALYRLNPEAVDVQLAATAKP